VPGLVYQFGDFQLDCGRFELVRNGHSLRIERKPMELLILLVSRRGQLVSRTEIAQRLWSSEVFVDTEHGINTAIRKLRHLLRDDPEDPKFIQTVTGMGYRFIAPITAVEATSAEAASPGAPAPVPVVAAEVPVISAAPPIAKTRPRFWLTVGISTAVLVATLALTLGSHPLAARLLHRDSQPAITSLAVIPLDNLSGDPNQEYFADGMTDELITMLARNSNLRITSRTSVMQYKGARKPLPEIARALDVDAILEGSISRSSGSVHMNLQLIRADTDTHLWAESYDRTGNEVAALPDDAAREIAERLHSAAVGTGHVRFVSPEAHDAFLRGRYFLEKREADKSAGYFQQAISIDPSWSQAYSGLARALQSEGVLGMMPPSDATEKGKAAARRAIELDPENGDAYSTLGLIQATYEWQWEDAEANLKHGIALSPNSSEAEFNYVLYLDSVNRPEEAVAHMRKALELDPNSFLTNRHLGSVLYFARHYDEALTHLNQAEEMEPGKRNFVEGWKSAIYEMKGMQDKAVSSELIAISVGDPATADRLRAIYRREGWNAYWEARMKMMLADKNDPCAPYDIGVNYIRLGKPEIAIPYFDRAIDQKCWAVGWIMVDPRVDKIRSDARYSDLLKRMNLPH
jgi:TolB-like protein/DNA-binding winged helix-turn-helix (wHTH) protein/Tfp pilus assembly protein PilF